MCKISIIVPIYKAETFLLRCTDSILKQTFSDLELILIDDGSPDNCPKLCDELAIKDSRVKVIHQKNAGVSAARNAGLDIAHGKYCTFVDSDDYIDACMYQAMMEKADQYDCDVVMCDCVKENGRQVQIYTHDIREGFYSRKQIESEYFSHLLMMPNVEYPPTISNWLCLFKTEIIQENALRYEEGIRFSEDLLFGTELMYHANSFYYMKGECYYHYCMNPTSATHTFAIDKWKDYLRLHKIIETRFCSCPEFNFSKQIDLVLLFFVYNAIGDILTADTLDKKEKREICFSILKADEVRNMFNRLSVWKLPITNKLKILTFMYKYRIGLNFLIARGR